MSNSILQAFKSLKVANDGLSDHLTIYEVSYEYLSKIKEFNDAKAFNNCLVALINLDNYDKALNLIKEVPQEVHSQFVVEKAYIYYKLGKDDELALLYEHLVDNAEGSIEGVPVQEIELRAIKHILAQHLYQRGHVAKALALYQELIDSNNKIDNEVDLATNERAILSQLPAGERPQPRLEGSEDSYDFTYNNALIEISNNNLEGADKLLDKAISQCGLEIQDPSELTAEIAPMKVAQAYVKLLQGHSTEALDILTSADLASADDPMVLLLVKNNTLALQGDGGANLNIVHGELNYPETLNALKQKLTSAQFGQLLKNHLLLSYQTGTLSVKSKYLSKAYQAKLASNDFSLQAYKTLISNKISQDDLEDSTRFKAAAAALKALYNHNANADVRTSILLLVAYIGFQTGFYDQALSLLESEIQNHPNDIRSAVVGAYYQMAQSIGGKVQEKSVQNLEKLANSTTSDALRQELQIWKYAYDGTEITSSEGLVPIGELTASHNVEELLRTNIDELLFQKPAYASESVATTQPKKRYVFSKNKQYTDKPPSDLDAERWLPKKFRSYYKPSKKEKRKGHQGALELTPTPEPSKVKKKRGKK